jgi:hypothetical protein
VTDVEHDIERISEEIQRSLLNHPYAADTLDGITKWWLENGFVFVPVSRVEKALDWLIIHHVVVKESLPDGGTVFSSTKKAYRTNKVKN